ncbi:MAG: hypothetical protein PHG44_05830 [Lentisphaeria bacterium]|nr:hypothetical protein [Lentisphaeria bacterium]
MQEKLLIGWGEADITPENAAVELSGQYYQRLATGIHSRLKTVALALEKAGQQALMLSLDLVNFPESFQTEMRRKITAEIAGLRPESIFFNAIHTHNAPYTKPSGLFRDWLPLDEKALKPAEYIAFLQEKVMLAVRQAWEARRPGGIAPAYAQASIGHCRRAVYADGSAEMYGDTRRDDFVGLEGGEDPGVEMLFTFEADGRPSGMILNVACPAQVMEASYEISSDYMGAVREKLKAEFSADFHCLCQISASGCQSPRDLLRNHHYGRFFWGPEGVEELSGRLLGCIKNAFEQSSGRVDFSPVFLHHCQRLQLPVRRASWQDYCLAQKQLQALLTEQGEHEAFIDFCRQTRNNEAVPERSGPFDDKLHHFVQIQNRKAIIKRYLSQDETPYFSFDMQSLRLGQSAMINCPFELYLHYAQIIKARSVARQSFVVQLSGGSGSYLPSPEAERLGGYGGMIINGIVGSEGGYKLADSAIAAIARLFED